jgi:hypothetical protein
VRSETFLRLDVETNGIAILGVIFDLEGGCNRKPHIGEKDSALGMVAIPAVAVHTKTNTKMGLLNLFLLSFASVHRMLNVEQYGL